MFHIQVSQKLETDILVYHCKLPVHNFFFLFRWMLGLAALPSIVQFIGFIFLPESPRWLIANGKSDKARTVLVNIRGTVDIETEVKEIEMAVEEDRREKELAGVFFYV